MKVIHITKTDLGGGLGSVGRLHRELLRLGHESMLYVLYSESDRRDPNVRIFTPPPNLASRIRRRAGRWRIDRDHARYRATRPLGADFFTDDRCALGADVLDQIPAGDILNIHTMFGFFDYRATLGPLAGRAPVVRTLHDMAFITGGCHVDRGCGKFVHGCGACPQLGSADPDDLSRQIWLRKRSAMSAVPPDRMWVVTPSRWLADAVKGSPLAGHLPVTVIPHGVDPDVFKPRDANAARDVLGIPSGMRVVLYVADPMGRPVKGFAVLAATLNGMTDVPNLMLVSVGRQRPNIEVRLPHLELDVLRSEGLLSLVYSAADLLVIPSLQENFPLVPLEAMACGVPVVGSDVGGIREEIRPGVNGLLVPPNEPAALREAIRELLNDPAKRAKFSARGRRIAVEEYSLARHVREYLELYQAIVSGRARNAHEPGPPDAAAPQGASSPVGALQC